MATSSGWNQLQVTVPSAPELFVKSNFSTVGYNVQLTDLSRVWAESLSAEEILDRAREIAPSIDPSESDEQFEIFLGKIDNALHGGVDTSLKLLSGKDGDLSMELSPSLPKGFLPFVWPLSLRRGSEDALREALVTPLLHQASSSNRQVEYLVSELQAKDRVIAKITDRLETSGNDLTTVFPGVSNIKTTKKRSQREQLAKHVKGLADFDQEAWRAKIGTIDNDREGLWANLKHVLEDLPQLDGHDAQTSGERHWWKGLSIGSSIGIKSEKRQRAGDARLSAAPGPSEEGTDSMGNDFQRQGTPDNLKRKAPEHDQQTPEDEVPVEQAEPSKPADDEDSTTEDEDDLGAVPSSKAETVHTTPQTPAARGTSSNATPKKLGALGGRSSKPSPSPSTPREVPREASREISAECNQDVPPPRAKLGAIGGKAKLGAIGGKTKPSQPASSTAHERAEPEASPPPPRKSTKMGVIGGKKAPAEAAASRPVRSTESPETKSNSQSAQAAAKESTPAPSETTPERADRKRQDLEDSLAQKAKVPVKKKRKF